MNVAGTMALEVTVTAPVASFRDPLYAKVQVGLPCPPPATIGGMLAAAAGCWSNVDQKLRFGMAFCARGAGTDLETYHPLDSRGRKAEPTPMHREFLADVHLTLWLVDDLDLWERRLRRPVWPLRLGRSQDLVGIKVRRTPLVAAPGTQGYALIPAEHTERGRLMRLPTAVSLDRSRTRWDSYRYDLAGRADTAVGELSAPDGRAVMLLPPTHPDQLNDG